MAARSFKKAEEKIGSLLKLGKRKRDGNAGIPSLLPAHPTRPQVPARPTMPVKRATKKGAKRATVKRKTPTKKAVKRTSAKKVAKKKKGPAKNLLAAYETH
ncbi:hypothetical protein OAH93_02785, partial [Flavobacteriales bacterium]|nr:hypothetical protein [Flavobacteriales bacterium]